MTNHPKRSIKGSKPFTTRRMVSMDAHSGHIEWEYRGNYDTKLEAEDAIERRLSWENNRRPTQLINSEWEVFARF